MHAFNTQLDRTVEDKFGETSNKTQETASKFYNKYFRKVMKHSQTQSLTIKELYGHLVDECNDLKNNLARVTH